MEKTEKSEFPELAEKGTVTKRTLSLKDMKRELSNEIFPANKAEELTLTKADIASITPDYKYSNDYGRRIKFAVFNINTQKVFISMSLQKALVFLEDITTKKIKSMVLNYVFPQTDKDYDAGWNWVINYEK